MTFDNNNQQQQNTNSSIFKSNNNNNNNNKQCILILNNDQKLNLFNETQLVSNWALFARCKDCVEDGPRLEYMCWRLWNHNKHLLQYNNNKNKQQKEKKTSSSSSLSTSSSSTAAACLKKDKSLTSIAPKVINNMNKSNSLITNKILKNKQRLLKSNKIDSLSKGISSLTSVDKNNNNDNNNRHGSLKEITTTTTNKNKTNNITTNTTTNTSTSNKNKLFYISNYCDSNYNDNSSFSYSINSMNYSLKNNSNNYSQKQQQNNHKPNQKDPIVYEKLSVKCPTNVKKTSLLSEMFNNYYNHNYNQALMNTTNQQQQQQNIIDIENNSNNANNDNNNNDNCFSNVVDNQKYQEIPPIYRELSKSIINNLLREHERKNIYLDPQYCHDSPNSFSSDIIGCSTGW